MTKKSMVRMVCALLCMFSSTAMANYQNPNLNWGYTDFMDAAIPGSGLIFNPKMTMYSGELKDGNGDSLPGTNDIDLVAFSPQLIYVGETELPYGLKWGVQALMAFVGLDVNSDLGLRADSGIVGDLCIGPFIGSAIPLGKDWVFHWFGEFDVYAPTGSYDKDAAFNAGANFWTFEPFISMTLQIPYGFEFSTRQHFAFNTKNSDYLMPDRYYTGDFSEHELKAGDLWHSNFSFSKSLDFISPLMRFGVLGYYGQQITEDEVDGREVKNSKEKVFAIGPGLQYTHIPEGGRKPSAIFSLKAYWESSVENRAEGTKAVFRIIIPF